MEVVAASVCGFTLNSQPPLPFTSYSSALTNSFSRSLSYLRHASFFPSILVVGLLMYTLYHLHDHSKLNFSKNSPLKIVLFITPQTLPAYWTTWEIVLFDWDTMFNYLYLAIVHLYNRKIVHRCHICQLLPICASWWRTIRAQIKTTG